MSEAEAEAFDTVAGGLTKFVSDHIEELLVTLQAGNELKVACGEVDSRKILLFTLSLETQEAPPKFEISADFSEN